MKAKITNFSLKGRADIWWEYVKNFNGIHDEELTQNSFKRLFKKKYLSKRYYDDKAKEFHEFWMGSMTNDEYTSKFLELLRYVPYLREEKAKVQRFINGFPVACRDQIELDEPRLLEEAIRNLKHCYQ